MSKNIVINSLIVSAAEKRGGIRTALRAVNMNNADAPALSSVEVGAEFVVVGNHVSRRDNVATNAIVVIFNDGVPTEEVMKFNRFITTGEGGRMHVYGLQESLETGKYHLVVLYDGEHIPGKVIRGGDAKAIWEGSQGTVRKYSRHYITSAGKLKEKSAIILADTANWWEAFNVSYLGALELMRGRKFTYSQLGKTAIRPFSKMRSPLVHGLPKKSVKSIAILIGEFDKTRQGALDGIQFLATDNSRFWGMSYQDRTACTKAQTVVIPSSMMMDLIYNYDKEPVVVISGKDDAVSKHTYHQIQEDIREKGGLNKGRVVIIKASDAGIIPDMFVDLNSLKMPWDFSLYTEIPVEMQEVYKERKESGRITVSTQVVGKMLVADYEATMKLLKELADETIADAFKIPVYDNLPTPEFLQAKGVVAHQVAKLDGEGLNKYRWILNSLKNTALRSAEKSCGEMKFAVDGVRRCIIADYTCMFGDGVLGVQEILLPGYHAGLKVSCVKYPAQGGYEYLNAVVVSEEKYLLRSKIVLTKKQYDFVKFMTGCMNNAQVMVSGDPMVAEFMAGLDKDTDHLDIFTDVRVTDILWKGEMVAVNIVAPKQVMKRGMNGKVVFDEWFAYKNMRAYMSLNNDDIGLITNEFNWTLFNILIDRNMKLFGKYVAAFGNNGNQKGVYVPVCTPERNAEGLLSITMTEEKFRAIIDQLKTIEITEENLLLFAKDISSASCRFYQELAIDSVKKFLSVHVYQGHIMSQFVLSPKAELDHSWDENEVTGKKEFNVRVVGKEKTGTLAELYRYFCDRIKEEFFNLAESIKEMPEALDGDLVEYTKAGWAALPEEEKAAILEVEKQSLTIFSQWKMDKDSDQFNLNADYVTSELRQILSKYDPETRVRVILGAWYSEAFKSSFATKLGISLLKEEFLYFVAAHSERDGAKEVVEQAGFNTDDDGSTRVIRVSTYDAKTAELFGNVNNAHEAGKMQGLRVSVSSSKLFISSIKTDKQLGEMVNGKGVLKDMYADVRGWYLTNVAIVKKGAYTNMVVVVKAPSTPATKEKEVNAVQA